MTATASAKFPPDKPVVHNKFECISHILPRAVSISKRSKQWAPHLARVYTNHDSQLSNPKQVMVIMFSVELGAVDEPHGHLKPFMKG